MFDRRIALYAVAIVAVLAVGFFAQSRDGAGVVRTYYIAADEVEWDFAPAGTNLVTGQPFRDHELKFAEAGPHHIGRLAKKAVYRAYTDSTFAELAPRSAEWEHLGILGPVVRAEVGDTIRIVFRNNASFPATVHPHGVFYDKDSEGAVYEDGTSDGMKADDGVPTGGTHVYVWPVPERAGPSEHEGSTAFWMYHSHVDEVRDVNSGLIGPMIVTRRGMARPDGSPTDVDREIVAALLEFDENESWYIEENVRTYAERPDEVRFGVSGFGNRVTVPAVGSFFKETINGLLYGNLTGLTMNVGERVRWYVMANTNFEVHSAHWHGNVVTSNMMRTDVAALLPMGMVVANMVPDNPGTWLFHCHVGTHLRMGMQAFYQVEPAPDAIAANTPIDGDG